MFYKTGEHGLYNSPLHAIITPRPIAWVSTVSSAGVLNLAPFSYFMAVKDSDPELVIISIANRGPKHKELFGYTVNSAKDTLANIRDTQELVINLVAKNNVDAMIKSSENVAHTVNEFELCGVTPVASELVAVPRVAESPIALECKLYREIDLPSTVGTVDSVMIIAEVLGTHLNDELIVDNRIQVDLVGRLGYQDYCHSGSNRFQQTRPDKYVKL